MDNIKKLNELIYGELGKWKKEIHFKKEDFNEKLKPEHAIIEFYKENNVEMVKMIY